MDRLSDGDDILLPAKVFYGIFYVISEYRMNLIWKNNARIGSPQRICFLFIIIIMANGERLID